MDNKRGARTRGREREGEGETPCAPFTFLFVCLFVFIVATPANNSHTPHPSIKGGGGREALWQGGPFNSFVSRQYRTFVTPSSTTLSCASFQLGRPITRASAGMRVRKIMTRVYRGLVGFFRCLCCLSCREVKQALAQRKQKGKKKIEKGT